MSDFSIYCWKNVEIFINSLVDAVLNGPNKINMLDAEEVLGIITLMIEIWNFQSYFNFLT